MTTQSPSLKNNVLMFCIGIIMRLVKTANWNSTGDDFFRVLISYLFRTSASFVSTSKGCQMVAAFINYKTLPTSVINCILYSRIWGSQGGEYEDGCLLGCSTVVRVYRRFRGTYWLIPLPVSILTNLWNECELIQVYTVLQPIRQPSLYPTRVTYKCITNTVTLHYTSKWPLL
jgi:hypothetical protein